MIVIKILILATIGAMIGWLTNIIAIQLLFRPLKPIKIPIIPITIQGLIPKRRGEISKSIGDIVEEELISISEIIDKVIERENINQMLFIIKRKINSLVSEKLPSIIPSPFKRMIHNYINDIMDEEGERMLKDLAEQVVHKATDEISLSKIVQEKIDAFELEKIEELIVSVARSELKHIEILGGVLGLIIGIFQGIIVIFL